MSGERFFFGEADKKLEEIQRIEYVSLIRDKFEPAVCLKEDDFEDVYGKGEISKDKMRVANLRSKFAGELQGNDEDTVEFQRANKEISQGLEYIIAYESEMSEWLCSTEDGIACYFSKTSEYDDIVNGADGVLEIYLENPKELGLDENLHHIALVVDVTFSKEEDTINKKLERFLKRAKDYCF